MLNVNHSVPRNCNFEHPRIFIEYQINKLKCRWFPRLKLFCAVILLRRQFLASSSFAQLVTQVSRANQHDDTIFFRGAAVQQPYLSGKKGTSKIFRSLKRFPTIVILVAKWYFIHCGLIDIKLQLDSLHIVVKFVKTDNIIGRTTICLAYNIKYLCRCPHQNTWTLGIYGRTWNANVWEFQRHRVSVEAHAQHQTHVSFKETGFTNDHMWL